MHGSAASAHPTAVPLPSARRTARAAGAAQLSASSRRHVREAAPARGGWVRAGSAAMPPPKKVREALQSTSDSSRGRSSSSIASARIQEDSWSLEDAQHLFRRDDDGDGKEASRRYMRTLSLFTFERWAFHRSTNRYARHMKGIFQSGIVRGLAQPLLSAGATATLVCVYEDALQSEILPSFMPSLMMPSLPFDITSFALSLLLVFRTNTSYDRWLQAVTVWGGISNRSRDTLRQLLTYSGGGSGSRTSGDARRDQEAMLAAAATSRWLVAFARSLKAQLTEDSDLAAELQYVLSPQEAGLLVAAQHRPSFALAVLSELAASAPVRASQRLRLDENLTFFQDCMGTCERILRTPIPLSYTRHTSRFMVIWLSCLPLGLWRYCGWGTIPLTVVITFLLLGIEEIGVAIEEPFSILPLEDFCHEIEFALASIVEQAPTTRLAAKEAIAAAMTASLTAEAAAAGSSSGSSWGDDGGGSLSAVAGVAAAMESNGVAPFSHRGGPNGRVASERLLTADAIYCSIDETDG